jgi:hypothetical protein
MNTLPVLILLITLFAVSLFFYIYLIHVPLLQAILHTPWLLPILLYIILLYIQFGDSTIYEFVLYNL